MQTPMERFRTWLDETDGLATVKRDRIATLAEAVIGELKAENEQLRRMADAHREHAQSAVENSASLNRLLSVAEARADAAEHALAQRAGGVKHVAYFDGGQFHWMSGIAPRNCELYTLTTEPAAPEDQQEPAAEFGNGEVLVDTGAFRGRPAVFVRPAPAPGPVGQLAPEAIRAEGLREVLPGEWFVTFPTDEQACAVADALVGRFARPSEQAVTEDDVAARLWKAEAEDVGAPASIAANRTRAAFDNQSDELKARWRKFAKYAMEARNA